MIIISLSYFKASNVMLIHAAAAAAYVDDDDDDSNALLINSYNTKRRCMFKNRVTIWKYTNKHQCCKIKRV